MELNEKLNLIAEVFEEDEGFLTPETILSSLDSWDSMTKLSLTIMLSEEFKKEVAPDDVKKMETVQDILNYMV